MQIPENDKEYKDSRIWFIVDGATAVTISLLTAGAFLAAILRALGISDSFNGIISAIPSLACVVQLLGLELAKRMKKTKFFVCIFAMIHRLLFTFIFFIPFLALPINTKVILFISLFLLANVLGQMIAPVAGNWISSLVIGNTRGKYFAIRDSIMVFVSVIISLIAAQVFDLFRASGHENSSFLFISGVLLAMTIINFVALSMVKEPRFSYFSPDNKEMHGTLAKKRMTKDIAEDWEKFRHTFKKVISNQRFKSSIILTVLWQSAFFFSTPYFGIYQISDLRLSYTYIMIMGFIGSLIRIIVTPMGGKVADIKSWGLVLKVALFIMAVAFIINSFTVPQNAHMMFAVFSVLTGIAWAGVAPGIFAIQLDLSPDGDKTAYLGINAAIMGLCGFISSVIGGYILQFMLDHNNKLLGHTIYGQQILSFGSGIMLFILVIYIKCRIEKLYTIEIIHNSLQG